MVIWGDLGWWTYFWTWGYLESSGFWTKGSCERSKRKKDNLPCKGKKAQVHFTKFSGGRFFCFMQQRLTSLRKWLIKHTIWIASPSWIHLRTFHHGVSNKFRRISHKVFSLCILSLNPRSVQRKKSASAVAVNKKNASTRSFATNNASAWLALYFHGKNGIASGKDNRK